MTTAISSTQIRPQIEATLTKDVDLSSAGASVKFSPGTRLSFANGTGANKANMAYADTGTVAASGSASFDLTALTNAFGDSIDFSKIKAVLIENTSADDADIEISGNFFGTEVASLVVSPGGSFMLVLPDADGRAVTDTTADEITLTNASALVSAGYSIFLLGEV